MCHVAVVYCTDAAPAERGVFYKPEICLPVFDGAFPICLVFHIRYLVSLVLCIFVFKTSIFNECTLVLHVLLCRIQRFYGEVVH